MGQKRTLAMFIAMSAKCQKRTLLWLHQTARQRSYLLGYVLRFVRRGCEPFILARIASRTRSPESPRAYWWNIATRWRLPSLYRLWLRWFWLLI